MGLKKNDCYVMATVVPKTFEPCFKVGKVKHDCLGLMDDPKCFDEFCFNGKEIEEASTSGKKVDCSKLGLHEFTQLKAVLVDSSVWLEAKNIFNDQKLDQRTKYLLAKKKFYSLLD